MNAFLFAILYLVVGVLVTAVILTIAPYEEDDESSVGMVLFWPIMVIFSILAAIFFVLHHTLEGTKVLLQRFIVPTVQDFLDQLIPWLTGK